MGKKRDDTLLYVTMGGLDGAGISELDGLHILDKLLNLIVR